MMKEKTVEQRIADLICEMDFQERFIFVSYYFNQMSVEELAEETGYTDAFVKETLSQSSNKAINVIGKGDKYYAALVSFLAMGEEAVVCVPP